MTEEDWLVEYRKDKSAVWIKARTTDGISHYYSSFDGWLKLKAHCDELKVFPEWLRLQFRSHVVEVDVSGEGVYLTRALRGRAGGETKQHYMVGTLKNGKVYKKLLSIPELEVADTYVDDLSQCFKEALIYNEETRTDREKQI